LYSWEFLPPSDLDAIFTLKIGEICRWLNYSYFFLGWDFKEGMNPYVIYRPYGVWNNHRDKTSNNWKDSIMFVMFHCNTSPIFIWSFEFGITTHLWFIIIKIQRIISIYLWIHCSTRRYHFENCRKKLSLGTLGP